MDTLSKCKLAIRNDIADSTFKTGFMHEAAGQDVLDNFDIKTINDALSDGYAFSDIPRDTMSDYIERMQDNVNMAAQREGKEAQQVNMPPEAKGDMLSDTFLSSYLADDMPDGEMYCAERPVRLDRKGEQNLREGMDKRNNVPLNLKKENKDNPDMVYTAGPMKEALDVKQQDTMPTVRNTQSFTNASNWTPSAQKHSHKHGIQTIDQVSARDALSNRDRKMDAQKQFARPAVDEFGRNEPRSKGNHRNKKGTPRRGETAVKRNETAFEVNRPKSKNHVRYNDISGPSR